MMTGTIDLLDDLMAQADVLLTLPDRHIDVAKADDCDGCGEFKPVDLWATNSETGEELWLCESGADR
jgi:hypothetical protein